MLTADEKTALDITAEFDDVLGGTFGRRVELGQRIATAIRDAEAAARADMRERAAAKIEEQSRLLTQLFEDQRHEALCRDLADAVRALE